MTGTAAYLPDIPDDLPAGPRPMLAAVDALPGHADELRAAITELAAAVRREPGCQVFVPYTDLGTAGRFHLYEIYQDTGAFQDHLQTAHVHRFFGALAQHSSTTAQSLVQLAELPVP